MRKFRFKLQTVLDQRLAVEERHQAELAALQRERALELARLGQLNEKLERAHQTVREVCRDQSGAVRMRRSDEYAKAVRDDIKVQELTLAAMDQRVSQKRHEVIEAVKERKVLESLRDKKRKAYLAEAARQEQNELDEMASARFASDL